MQGGVGDVREIEVVSKGQTERREGRGVGGYSDR